MLSKDLTNIFIGVEVVKGILSVDIPPIYTLTNLFLGKVEEILYKKNAAGEKVVNYYGTLI